MNANKREYLPVFRQKSVTAIGQETLPAKFNVTANSLKSYLSRSETALPLQRDAQQSASEILRLHNANGGATFSLYFGSQAGQRLYSVSMYPERSVLLPGRDIPEEVLQEFVEGNMDLLHDPRCCVGTWYDADADETYIDVSVTLLNKKEVIRLGKRYNQVGVFDLFRMEYLPTGGTGETVENALSELERLPQLKRRQN